MSTAVVFTNFSDEPFTGLWDGVQYNFAPGQTMMVEDWKAHHFAKHLVNREMQKLDKNSMFLQDPRRESLFSKALPGVAPVESEDESSLETKLLNQDFACPECDFTSKSSRGLNIHMSKHERKETEESKEEVFEEV